MYVSDLWFASAEVRRKIAFNVICLIIFKLFIDVKNCDILMNDAKENPTGFVAYLSYVRELWGVSDKVSRKIAQFS